MERKLLLLRHGKSQHDLAFATDFERPLAPRGIKAARMMGRLMLKHGLVPDLIVSSPANRALTTAQLVQDKLAGVTLLEDHALYTASIDDLYSVLHSLDDDLACVLLVGHNYVFEEFVDSLIGQHDTVLKTCSLAVLSSDWESWSAAGIGTARLIALYHPRELDP